MDLTRELKKLWNMKVMVIPIVIGSLGTVTKALLQVLDDLEITNGDHPNNRIVKISLNTAKSPGDFRRLSVTQTPVNDHQLTLIGKTLKEQNNCKFKKKSPKFCILLLILWLDKYLYMSKAGDHSQEWLEEFLFNSYYTKVKGKALLFLLDCFTLSLINTLSCWVLSKEASSTIFESLVWLDLRKNSGLTDRWQTLYSSAQWPRWIYFTFLNNKSKVKLVTVVEDDPKTQFLLATT